MSENAKVIRRGLSKAFTYALVVLWIIPVSFVSSLSNLEAISKNGPFSWLGPVFTVSPVITGIVQGYLPTIVLAVFMAVLPMILMGA